MNKGNVLLIILCLLLPMWTGAQSSDQRITLIDTTLVFDNSSKKIDLPFEVPSGTSLLDYDVKGEIKTGILSVNFQDDQKKKCDCLQLCATENDSGYSYSISASTSKGNTSTSTSTSNSNRTNTVSTNSNRDDKSNVVSITNSKTSESESSDKWSGAKGNMSESYENPSPGKWSIKIEPKKATGNCHILVYIEK